MIKIWFFKSFFPIIIKLKVLLLILSVIDKTKNLLKTVLSSEFRNLQQLRQKGINGKRVPVRCRNNR